MQFVRCGACGAKALPAASRCPRCAQPLNLRDEHGTLVPLARCPVCDTYYPRAQGRCRWCADAPPAASRRTAPWIVAAVVVVALGAGTWWMLSRRGAPTGGRVTSTPPATSAPGPAAPPAVTAPSPDTGSVRTSDSTARDSAARDTARVTAPTPPPQATPSASPPGTRWVAAEARTWVNVHDAPQRTSRTIGVVQRGARVELGESQDGWRRVRSTGLLGWVDANLFVLAPTAAR